MGNSDNTISIDELINMLNSLDNAGESKDDAKSNDSMAIDKNKEAFYKEFYTDGIIKRFTGACSAIMVISTVTGISIDDVFRMFVDEMDRELHEDDTKAMMDIGKHLTKLFNDICKMED